MFLPARDRDMNGLTVTTQADTGCRDSGHLWATTALSCAITAAEITTTGIGIAAGTGIVSGAIGSTSATNGGSTMNMMVGADRSNS